MIVSIPYLSYYKPQETAKMMGGESTHEANSKKTFLTILLQNFTNKLVLGHVSRLQTEPENSKLIVERKYGKAWRKTGLRAWCLILGYVKWIRRKS